MKTIPELRLEDFRDRNRVEDALEEQDSRITLSDKELNALAEPFAPGSYFIIMSSVAVIFGVVECPLSEGNDEDELFREQDAYDEMLDRGYIYGRCFSVIEPEGELGSNHIGLITARIDEATFNRAKANGWRSMAPLN